MLTMPYAVAWVNALIRALVRQFPQSPMELKSLSTVFAFSTALAASVHCQGSQLITRGALERMRDVWSKLAPRRESCQMP